MEAQFAGLGLAGGRGSRPPTRGLRCQVCAAESASSEHLGGPGTELAQASATPLGSETPGHGLFGSTVERMDPVSRVTFCTV